LLVDDEFLSESENPEISKIEKIKFPTMKKVSNPRASSPRFLL
jgi:hypothetical protein